jgi:hypothetical protein
VLADPSKGDCYTFIALDAISKAIISYRIGKRDAETTVSDRSADARARHADDFQRRVPAIR